MKGFIVVNSIGDGEMLINVSAIVSVARSRSKTEDRARIWFPSAPDDFIETEESYEEVVEMIKQAIQ